MTETSEWSELESQLQETKELLGEIEQRFLQVRRASIEQQELKNQQQNLKSQIQELQIQENSSDRINKNSKLRRKPNSSKERSTFSPSNVEQDILQKQLQELSDRLEQIEGDLESRLLSWSSFREPFWQIVRFGGIGVIIGVILKSCAT